MNSEEITRALSRQLGITELRPMQKSMLSTRNSAVRLAAPTGSGKTVAFAAYLLRRVGQPNGTIQAVVLVPSRELALQVGEVIRKMAQGLKTVTLYGGHSVEDETKSLQPVPDIVIATPGRLLDHLNRRRVDLSTVSTLVIDEYDKSLELGFETEMKRLRRAMPRVDNIVVTSATAVTAPPEWIGCKDFVDFDYSENSDAESPTDIVEIESPARDKADTLIATLLSIRPRRAIVFVNHRESAERTYTLLRRAGIDTALYHGGLEQRDRGNALAMLANGSARVVVATDLAARGLDIDGLDAVIHYHIPSSREAWTHRNGRTGRNGAEGTVYIIRSEADSIPDYIEPKRSWSPKDSTDNTLKAPNATLHINAGRKEKISRGDVVGFLVANGGLAASEIGRIDVADHQILVAVPREKARSVVVAVAPFKLKNKRVRVTQMKL